MICVVKKKQASVTVEVEFLGLMGCFSSGPQRRTLGDLRIRLEEFESMVENALWCF
ncbi:MAG: hypothetical protein ACERKP_07545 [Deltaproteobacteria bacterium]|jgi:hypothetical protein